MSETTAGEKTLNEQAERCNLPQWWGAGFTGKNITVWDVEDLTTHGKTSRKRVIQAAPDAKVINGHLSYKTKNGEVFDAFVYVNDEEGNETPVPLEEFIANNNVRIITSSMNPDAFSKNLATIINFWTKMVDKYDLCIFSCSGNDHKDTYNMNKFVGWQVGALQNIAGKGYKRGGYSNAGPGLDFVDFTGPWNGTSFSTPYLAGKAALLLQRWPQMTHQEVYDFMKNNCEDFGDPGEDNYYGHGLFVFPDVNLSEDEKEQVNMDTDNMVTKTKMLVNNEIKEVKRILYKDENYVRIRDLEDVLGICDVEYDAAKNLPIIKTK